MSEHPITNIDATAYTIPTQAPESDGTLSWSSTTLVLVRVVAGDVAGLGYTYGDRSSVTLIGDRLRPVVMGQDALAISALWNRMRLEARNLGTTGVVAMAISAVDNALWDLKARILGLPLVALLGDVRERVPVYGSGGFTSYDRKAMQAQLDGWLDLGIDQIKIKIGRGLDAERIHEARSDIGSRVRLFVDANGAYAVKQALHMTKILADAEVIWFEEPVPAWDIEGLHEISSRAPASMDISSGEYAWSPLDIKRLIDARAVDVLQADATRCLGISGLIDIDALCRIADMPLSTHCAPAQHLHAACALTSLRHLEFFHDHVLIERMLFDGIPSVINGRIRPDRTAPGNGLVFKHADARKYQI